MMKPPRKGGNAVELRRRAEERLAEAERAATQQPQAPGDAMRLVHELQVHQIELEMQNEELLRSRAELQDAVKRYGDLFDFAPTGYFSLERDGTIRELNLAGATLLGLERARLVGSRFEGFVLERDRSMFNDAFLCARGHAATGVCEVGLNLTGGRRWVQLNFAGSADEDTCRLAVVDVSARKNAEERLRVSQRLEAVGLLAGGVAHDFNNLLTVILTHAEFALESAGAVAPLRKDLLTLKEAAERAAALTRQLLAFGRKQVMRPARIDLSHLVRSLADILRGLLGEQVELVLDLEDIGTIDADAVQIEQVALNLTVNARDAMPHGGTLTISTANVEVGPDNATRTVQLEPGPFVRLTVRDNGVGMDPATLAHVFEPFFTTKEQERGTGLGLSTVYGIVKQCGGDIAVHSECGSGTVFDCYFPRAAAPATLGHVVLESPAPSVAQAPKSGGQTILIVEDEAPLRRISARILAGAGYVVLMAGSGESALSLCNEHRGPIHLVLSDVMMPNMTGPALAERVRLVRPETRILYMSGYSPDDVRLRCSLGGGARLVEKPFTTEGLRQAVREVLEGPHADAGSALPHEQS